MKPRRMTSADEMPRLRRGPAGEGQAVDLGVVTDVHREGGMEKETRDARGVDVGLGQRPQFAGEGGFVGQRIPGLHDERGRLRSAGSESDQRAARHRRVRAESRISSSRCCER